MEIKIRNRDFCFIIDPEDFALVSPFYWNANGKGYPSATINGKTVGVHRLILGLAYGDGKLGDHINGDKLDNRRANLRVCTRSQNQCNRKRPRCKKLEFRGIKSAGRSYIASIMLNRKTIHLGTFKDPTLAALAYDKAAKELHGEFARLNFPDLKEVC